LVPGPPPPTTPAVYRRRKGRSLRAERPAPERRALQECERQPAGCSAAPGAASAGTADPTVAPDRLDPLAAGDPDHLGATVTEQGDQHAADRAGRAPHQGRLARKWPHPGQQVCGAPGAGQAGGVLDAEAVGDIAAPLRQRGNPWTTPRREALVTALADKVVMVSRVSDTR
jgi:hypothetical protein